MAEGKRAITFASDTAGWTFINKLIEKKKLALIESKMHPVERARKQIENNYLTDFEQANKYCNQLDVGNYQATNLYNLTNSEYIDDETKKKSIEAADIYRKTNNLSPLPYTNQAILKQDTWFAPKWTKQKMAHGFSSDLNENGNFKVGLVSLNYLPNPDQSKLIENILTRTHEIGHRFYPGAPTYSGNSDVKGWFNDEHEQRVTARALKQFFANFYRRLPNGKIIKGGSAGEPFIIKDLKDAQEAIRLFDLENIPSDQPRLYMNKKQENEYQKNYPKEIEGFQKKVIQYIPEEANLRQRGQRNLYDPDGYYFI